MKKSIFSKGVDVQLKSLLKKIKFSPFPPNRSWRGSAQACLTVKCHLHNVETGDVS